MYEGVSVYIDYYRNTRERDDIRKCVAFRSSFWRSRGFSWTLSV